MLRVETIPGVDQLVELQTQVRHTTVIVLPENETILDFVVGDSEYWHLTGAANVAFLKPIATGVETNVALICESGRIYSFLATEGGDPHLVVRIEAPPEEDLISAAAHTPAFIARSEVTAYQVMARQAQEAARSALTAADTRAAQAQAAAAAAVEQFRADYPTRSCSNTNCRIVRWIHPSVFRPCGTTDSSPTCDPPPRNPPHSMKSRTASLRWLPTISPKTASTSCAACSARAGFRSASARAIWRYRPED